MEPNTERQGFQDVPQPGYPAAAQPGYPAAPPPGYSAAPQPGYPAAPQPGYPPGYDAAASKPGYPVTSQPGYPATAQPGFPDTQQPGFAHHQTTVVSMQSAPAVVAVAAPPLPNSYLALGIVTLLFCCLPFGIVSVVYASQVNSIYAAGDYEEANRKSRNARSWGVAALVTGCVLWAINIIRFVAV